MDDNTTKVIMAVIALISAVVTPLVLVWVTNMQNKKIDKNQAILTTNQESVAAKVEEYHKEVNGNMSKLLKTTEELAIANEKARNLAEAQTETHTIPPTGTTNLKIVEGEIKVKPGAKK